jgi:Capsid protein VP4
MTSRKKDRAKDLPIDQERERLKGILGHGVSQEFVEWYRQDTKPGGFTTPFLRYQGPGNPTNIGEPVNEADKFAEKHDLQYAYASYKYQKGHITKDHYEKKITKIDEHFMANNAMNITGSMNPGEQLSSVIGTVGIGLKYAAETVIGQQYPDTDKNKAFTPTPITSTKLADKLFGNLKKNISSQKAMEVEGTSKRKAGEVTPIKAKTQKVADTPTKGGDLPQAAVPAQAEVAIPDIEMASLTGTGKEQASGGASSEGMMVHYIEKPLSIFSTRENIFKKSHKFMTFGLAPNFINLDTLVIGSHVLTSYLAEVPWHIPALYMNQSEFDLLSVGAKCKSVSIEVIYRGSTIQFETNASATGLATLNQINDIAVANGLNRTGWGSNYRYTAFSSTQPMIPTDVTYPTYAPVASAYRGMVEDFYGGNNPTAAFINSVPKHQIGRQTFLYNYWCNTARGGTAAGATTQQYGGWPCLAEKISQMDGKTVVNQCVMKSTYEPKLAPLKKPLTAEGHGLPFQGMNINVGDNLVQPRVCQIAPANQTASSGITSGQGEIQAGIGNTNAGIYTDPSFTIYSPIEKCQMGRSGSWGNNLPHIQPSIHIGVQPVPALSTSASIVGDGQFNSWTDTRAYWEVIATMVTEEYNPTAWPYAKQANVPIGDVINWYDTGFRPAAIQDPTKDGATYAGLYTNTFTTLQ